jgi:hypothetical protein
MHHKNLQSAYAMHLKAEYTSIEASGFSDMMESNATCSTAV